MEQTPTSTDSMLVRGYVTVDVVHEDGSTETVAQSNVVTNVGRNKFASLLAQDISVFPSHIAIGTGTTAAAVTDTALVTEVDRNALISDSAATGVITYKAFFSKAEANGNTIAEVGLFDAASSGNMFCRSVLSSTIAKTSTVSLSVTWTITLADA
jgi:hypothetical protein